MDRVLNNFIVSLRGAGVPVSVSESIDAAQALAISGYGDRQIVKSSLAATLDKSAAEKEIFDACFERFFSFQSLPSPNAAGTENGSEEQPGDMPPIGGMIMEGDLGGVALPSGMQPGPWICRPSGLSPRGVCSPPGFSRPCNWTSWTVSWPISTGREAPAPRLLHGSSSRAGKH